MRVRLPTSRAPIIHSALCMQQTWRKGRAQWDAWSDGSQARAVNEQRPCGLKETRKAPLYCPPRDDASMLPSCARARPPHRAFNTGRGEARGRNSSLGKNPPQLPAHRSRPGPTTLCAYVWPRPGGSCRCTKVGDFPFTCARAVVAAPAATLGGAEEAKTQDNQSNAKPEARGAKGQGGLSPARALPRQLAQHQRGRHP